MKYLSVLFLSVSILTFSQTKKIAFKSHSGNAANFEKYLNHKMFDSENSNLGIRANNIVTTASLDTVVFINKEKQVMITSNYCTNVIDDKNSGLWKEGKDTMEHDLFSQNHNLRYIKKELKEKYNFQNDIDGVVFIGYDNDSFALQKEKRKEEIKLNEEAIKKTKAELKKLKKELKKRKKTKIQGVGFGFGLMILLVGGVYWLKNK